MASPARKSPGYNPRTEKPMCEDTIKTKGERGATGQKAERDPHTQLTLQTWVPGKS